jgi:hypothetical protein
MYTLIHSYQDFSERGDLFISKDAACKQAKLLSENPICNGTVKVVNDDGFVIATFCDGSELNEPNKQIKKNNLNEKLKEIRQTLKNKPYHNSNYEIFYPEEVKLDGWFSLRDIEKIAYLLKHKFEDS